MRLASMLVLCAVALAGCGGSTQADSTGKAGEVAFELPSGSAAGIRATLSYVTRDRTRIRVDGLDEGESGGGGANPVWLKRGTCDQPLDTVQKLEALRGSTSKSSVHLGLSALLNGDYLVAVGLPKSTEVLACGEVPHDVQAGGT
jgi:hypothetical protein